jgi:hypothetical protein
LPVTALDKAYDGSAKISTGTQIPINLDLGLLLFYVSQHRILRRLNKHAFLKDPEIKIRVLVSEHILEIGFLEPNLETVCPIANGASEQIVEDQILVPGLDAESRSIGISTKFY